MNKGWLAEAPGSAIEPDRIIDLAVRERFVYRLATGLQPAGSLEHERQGSSLSGSLDMWLSDSLGIWRWLEYHENIYEKSWRNWIQLKFQPRGEEGRGRFLTEVDPPRTTKYSTYS